MRPPPPAPGFALALRKRVAAMRAAATRQKNKEHKAARAIVDAAIPSYDDKPIGGSRV